MRKIIFLISTGSYSDYGIESAWTTKEGAEKRVAEMKDAYAKRNEEGAEWVPSDWDHPTIEEYYLDEPTPNEDPLWSVVFFKNDEVRVDKLDSYGRVVDVGNHYHNPARFRCLASFTLHASDEATAIKSARDKWAQDIALGKVVYS